MNEDILKTISMGDLTRSAQAVSARYRALERPYLRSYNDYVAYVAMRLPGTLAAVSGALKHIPPQVEISSFLDLGAGPGTGWMAVSARYPHIQTGTLIEADKQFIELGHTLISADLQWQHNTLPCALQPHDLVLMSYSLGEIPNPELIILDAWSATNKVLVIVEPGTPKGYQLIMQMRDILLAQGAHMVAPCPNALACPMVGGDWCHFPARVERSKMHMQLKGGSLGYEDEKYAYLILSKTAVELPRGRIIANPIFHKGHVESRICTEGSIADIIVSKRDGEFYKRARKSRWGDAM